MSTDNSTKRQTWQAIKWGCGLGGGFILIIFLANRTPQDVTVSQSPDGLHRIVVRQPRFVFMDRNFRVVLIETSTKTEREIFRSLDQSPTIESERLVWSADSKAVGLFGDKYYVVPNSQLPTGEIVFLVYNLDTGKLWCNADDDTRYGHITAQAAAKMLGI